MKVRHWFAIAASLVVTAATAAAAQGPAKHMLFRVRGPSGATVYLLGSVHLLDSTAGKLPAVVDSAFLHAHTVVFETSLDSVMQRGMELVALAKYPAGKSLATELPPADMAKIDSLLARYGLSSAALGQFKPWFLSVFLEQVVMQRAGFQPQYGVDEQLNARAKQLGKPIVGLESVDFQLHLFDTLSALDQEKMLLETESPDSAAAELESIRAAWLAGDTATIDRALNKDARQSPEVWNILVANRTKSWLPKIEAMLAGRDDVLVVVGAGHLVGREGLIELLERDGYRVEQM
ncbi:MAG TPA: TraB/GumN family protein [Gemmatimonadaceae bacterium]|nr:TraB/GumN family protein [Gemmatimonadaceae bacterium]